MRLADIADIQMGYPFRTRLEQDANGDIAVIQMKDVDEGYHICADAAVRVVLPKPGARHLLRAGDLIFRSRGWTNGAALVPSGIGTAVLAAPLLLIRPHGALPEYLLWYLNATGAQAQLSGLAEGTSVRMISTEALKGLDIPLPSLQRQHTIAAAAALADEEQRLLADIARRKRQLMTRHLMISAHEKPS